MGILSGNSKEEPLHYGEVHGVWSAVYTTQGMVAAYQTMMNHVGDKDLKKVLDEALQLCLQDLKQLEPLLKEHGVGLPPAPPERPDANLEDIPTGARINDPEVAATLSADVAAGLVACSTMIGQAIREDIATLFGQMHTQKAQLGGKLLRLNKEKGWLVPPPLHKGKTEE
ncbi:DUF3231 family protein [Salinibacillus xinjiangensis]|uniref:DUF3231 family protein n=1 Tax=Salinibacillus xinjiangensis TaxID=1229268 RepID=A0A6G1X7F6_9BACI|nr:DUF3231 family protein [Salinibacillus xinjiangensis]MRG86877.1 DUF3231 family protein [Salinibacillus xinjiangensis]